MRVVSYGGGVQSTALLVLAAQGVIDFDTFLFANVGDDSEHPATLDYVRGVAFDYAAANGITIHELDKRMIRGERAGEIETLYGRLTREGSRSLPIPVRMSNGAPGTRSCTSDFKIKVVGRWLRQNGASKDHPATVAIGISADEWTRANPDRAEPYERLVYPLLDTEHRLAPRGGLTRDHCKQLITDAGLPIPPKSSCWFCPFHRPTVWNDMRRDEPDLFERAAKLEDLLNDRRDMLGKDHVYLTRFGRPIRDVFETVQMALFDEDDNDQYRCGDVCDT